MFTKQFDKYAYEGDRIECDIDGFTCRATLYRDDCSNKPDERDDGFWPSRDKNAAGYVKPRDFKKQQALAERVMAAWLNDEWFYCGISVTVRKAGVELVARYECALWGIECNYPDSDNACLRDVANELLGEAIANAKAKLSELCDCED